MTLRISNQGPTLSDHDIKLAETMLGVKFPSIYKSFLVKSNGGIPNRQIFTIPDHPDGSDKLDFFLGINHNDRNMDMENYSTEFQNYSLRGILIIGMSASSSFLCVNIHGHASDVVGYIDIADPFDASGMKRIWQVAPDIDVFCKSLT